MKTSEQIQSALSLCKRNSCSKSCPYHGEKACYVRLHLEASILIRQLERERDAAVEDLEAGVCCATCLHADTDAKEPPCATCRDAYAHGNWEWRGAQEVE